MQINETIFLTIQIDAPSLQHRPHLIWYRLHIRAKLVGLVFRIVGAHRDNARQPDIIHFLGDQLQYVAVGNFHREADLRQHRFCACLDDGFGSPWRNNNLKTEFIKESTPQRQKLVVAKAHRDTHRTAKTAPFFLLPALGIQPCKTLEHLLSLTEKVRQMTGGVFVLFEIVPVAARAVIKRVAVRQDNLLDFAVVRTVLALERADFVLEPG